MWIVFIIVLCVAFTVNTLRPVQTTEDLRTHRQEPTINPASLPDVGSEGPRLTRGDGDNA